MNLPSQSRDGVHLRQLHGDGLHGSLEILDVLGWKDAQRGYSESPLGSPTTSRVRPPVRTEPIRRGAVMERLPGTGGFGGRRSAACWAFRSGVTERENLLTRPRLLQPRRDPLLIDGVEVGTDDSVVGQFESEG